MRRFRKAERDILDLFGRFNFHDGRLHRLERKLQCLQRGSHAPKTHKGDWMTAVQHRFGFYCEVCGEEWAVCGPENLSEIERAACLLAGFNLPQKVEPRRGEPAEAYLARSKNAKKKR